MEGSRNGEQNPTNLEDTETVSLILSFLLITTVGFWASSTAYCLLLTAGAETGPDGGRGCQECAWLATTVKYQGHLGSSLQCPITRPTLTTHQAGPRQSPWPLHKWHGRECDLRRKSFSDNAMATHLRAVVIVT